MTSTQTKDKVRSLFLAALMVTSIAGGAVAFTGTVAATANASASANPATVDSGSTHTVSADAEGDSSLTSIVVDYSVGSPTSDISNVGQGDVTVIVNGNDVTNTVTDVSSSNNGETLTITLDGTTSVSAGDTVTVEYSDVQNPSTAGSAPVDITINGEPAATAQVTYDSTGAFDTTQNANTTRGLTVEAANVSDTSATDNVSYVDVNLAFGSQSTGITADDVEHVNVELYNSEGQLIAENRTVPYDSLNTRVSFDGTAANTSDSVERVYVSARLSDSASDGDTIDAGVEAVDDFDGSLLVGSSYYDTQGTQILKFDEANNRAPGVISAYVNSFTQGDVESAQVFIINTNTGNIVNPDNPLTTNTDGNTLPLGVPYGDYRAQAQKGGFTTETSAAASLTPADDNRQLDVTLQATAEPKRVVLEPVDTTSGPADDSTLVEYRATVYGQIGEETDVRLEGIDVTLSDNGDLITLGDEDQSVTAGAITNTTNANGETYFTARSGVVQSATLNATVTNSTTTIFDTAPVRFGVLSGEGQFVGQVFDGDTTSGLDDATVWTVTSAQYRSNTIWTTVDVTDFGASAGDTLYYRVIDQDTGEVMDNDEYEVEVGPDFGEDGGLETQVRLASEVGIADPLAGIGELEEDDSSGPGMWNQDEQVGLVDSLNTTNNDVGQGFFATDRNDDSQSAFLITPLEAGNYTVQVSTKQTNASREASIGTTPDDPFQNVSATDVVIQTSENLTSDQAAADSSADGPQLIDETNEDGDYLLDQLYTDGQAGVYYTIIAEKTGYDRDFADVLVTENGATYEDQNDETLVLEERDVDPVVNIDAIALLPSTDAAPSDAANPDAYEEYAYNNQSDGFTQVLPRDDSAVEVDLLQTTAESSGDPINGTVTVTVPDNELGSTDANEDNFNGEWTNVAGGTILSQDSVNNTITVATGDDGQAILWLQSDVSTQDLGVVTPPAGTPADAVTDEGFFSGVYAQSTTDEGATDATAKAITGITQFGSLSGIVTDESNNPIADAGVWVEAFQLNENSVEVRIERLNNTHATVSIYEDSYNASQPGFEPAELDNSNFLVTSEAVAFEDLANYRFEDFNSTVRQQYGLVAPDPDSGFTLYTKSDNDAGFLGKYTLPRVPAKASNNQYSVRAESPVQQLPGLGDGQTRASVTDDVNLVIVGATPSDFQVSNLGVDPVNATSGDTVTVTADIENGGSVASTEDATIEVLNGSTVVSTQTVTTEIISGGETVTISSAIDTTGLDAGSYTVQVSSSDDTEATTLTIESSGDETTTIQDVLSVIDEYNNGNATIQDILAVIDAYNADN
ncbi:surface glycoprotein [Haloarchaeobius sp. FL176]|uniref:beta strand repeat-containing protein n=1 Tax=Haloarchaeobius sp. FL176 TaxID=2967129 RepID=UPI002147391E|nr:surface glycoprotein [Haloarchaeobius sp. FL176]